MDIKLAFFLGLFFIVTVKCDVQKSDNPKTCQGQGPSQSGGLSLDEMIGKLRLCNAEEISNRHEMADMAADDANLQQTESTDTRYNPQRSQQIAQSVLELSQKLTQRMMSESNRKYEIVSPISIASALQLTLLGSNGDTFNELMNLLNYNGRNFSGKPYQIHEEFGLLIEDLINNSPSTERVREPVPWRGHASKEYVRRAMRHQSNKPNYDEHKITVANGIFVQRDYTIRREYQAVVEHIYRGEIENLNFRGDPVGSAKIINEWVNEKTNGKIKEIIPGSTNPETRVILANALYFKAEWQETFIEGATQFKNFYPNGKDSNESVSVELMAHGGKFPHYYDSESDCEILGLPYKQNATTMYVIMPKNSNREKLIAAQKILTAEKIEDMISKMVIKTAVMLFPKMHLTSGHCLKTYLTQMGLTTLFDRKASDLSLLSDGLSSNEASPPKLGSPHLRPTIVRTPTSQQNLDFDPTSQLIFGRLDDKADEEKKTGRGKRDVTYKTESETSKKENPLTVKDFMLRKRIVKKTQSKKSHRSRRQISPLDFMRFDMLRNSPDLVNPYLYAEEVIHKVDLTVNEKGTEGGAATAITLNRSGTNIVFRVDVPFMFLIRHDPTHVPLFYGVVFEPEN